ncbi:PAS domain-containing protein [Flavobacterium oreochromis]|uniref:Histidine kinase n=2 Tax=Flavobacterium TaxID=237 RepID=A0A246GCQ1_9FLAO|nr:histidine kinase [Flavobacterium oreochromis]OWP77518.1 histidine kinase [Flavobacterium oreochromis]POR20777.1 histidine kinase [Flavobacterium columnare]QYS87705.1 PAS domain-containing protein [Flavobacterium oreochromis]
MLMSNNAKPIPVDREVNWNKSRTIVSKTDQYGTIVSVNDVFLDVSGYTEKELLKQPHNVIRHPDMPKAIFKILWDNLKRGENFYGIVKNMAKSGEYYWVLTDFDIVDGNKGYQARRVAVPEDLVKKEIEPLYHRIRKLEEFYGADGGENYLKGFLEKEGKTYVEYIRYIMDKYSNPNFEEKVMTEEESRSFLRRLFG